MQDEPAYVESLYGRLSFGWAPLHGWRERGRMFIDAPTPELYDLENDPAESVNLARAQAPEVARLQRLVRAAAATAAPAIPVAGSRDVLHRLQGLGYISGDAVARPSLRDPKELLGVAERVEKAMACERTSPPTAIDEFRAVLAQDPVNPLARRRLGLVLAGERRFDEALAELRPLVAAGNAGAEGLTLVADCLRLTGRASEALDVAREASAADPRWPRVPTQKRERWWHSIVEIRREPPSNGRSRWRLTTRVRSMVLPTSPSLTTTRPPRGVTWRRSAFATATLRTRS